MGPKCGDTWDREAGETGWDPVARPEPDGARHGEKTFQQKSTFGLRASRSSRTICGLFFFLNSAYRTDMEKPKDINEYIASIPASHRPALKILRAQMKKLYPKSTEHIGYGRPLIKLDGHPLGGFQSAKNHSSLFVWSGTAFTKIRTLLKDYDTAMGTIRFPHDKPLPLKIVKAILAERAKEIAARWPKKK